MNLLSVTACTVERGFSQGSLRDPDKGFGAKRCPRFTALKCMNNVNDRRLGLCMQSPGRMTMSIFSFKKQERLVLAAISSLRAPWIDPPPLMETPLDSSNLDV
jgi:hypothetical protein